jgi:glycosyltransferase involved in cell wall biosynthesis
MLSLGDAGILIDPTDEAAWTRAIIDVVSDGEKRGRLREAGLRRAGEFTWERTARLTLDVYLRTVAR